jgi:hypothetical protein
VGGDREYRHLAAVCVVETIDQMKIAGTATAGADRQVPGEMRLCSRGKGSPLFMAHVNPVDGLQTPERIREAVERVPDTP